MNVLEAIQRSTEFLERKGVESPRLQAEWLLAHVLGLARLKLYLQFERRLAEEEVSALRELVRRRGQREPLQHLLGTSCFCGIDLQVNRNVLIPRPETELLAERGWQFLQECVDRGVSAPWAFDFGTGSGCLAIAVARHCPAARLEAIESSPTAIELAKANASRAGVGDRIDFRESDGFVAVPAGARFDLLLANPPYIPSAEIERLEPEVRNYEPRPALDGGADGLGFFRLLAGEGAAYLKPGGRFMGEFGAGQAEAVRSVFESAGWRVLEVVSDYSGHARICIAEAARN